MIALLRRWRERRRLLRSVAELEYVARRRDEAAASDDVWCVLMRASLSAIGADPKVAWDAETADMRTRASTLREEAERLARSG